MSNRMLLGLALILGIAAGIFWILASKTPEKGDTWKKCAQASLIGGACFVVVAAVWRVTKGTRAPPPSTAPVPPPPPATLARTAVPAPSTPGGVPPGDTQLLILSADSWCGFSKKMTAEVPALRSLLVPLGIEIRLVNDTDDKTLFRALSEEHSAKGFPHSVLLRSGKSVGAIPGYQPAQQMKETIERKLTSL